jgi:two-component system chemotaxis response regulator CheB
MKPCSVLVVDDSSTMRALISEVLGRDPEIRVVGEAADPLEARQAIKVLDPDVVTLDIEMPKMNGLDFLERIMQLRPTRVIIVSSLTEKGATASIRALEIGAYDCVSKPTAKNLYSFDNLAARVKAAAASPLAKRKAPHSPPPVQGHRDALAEFKPDGRVVAMGSSMGGVEALVAVLSKFPENCPPTVVAQHMPALFTKSFADRLDRLCKPCVREATNGASLAPGHVYIAPGGAAHLEIMKANGLHCRLREGPLVSGHRPSIDVLFHSAAQTLGPRALGVILTGMGRDGAEGLLSMRRAGAETIGQDEASSLVYGMPKVAFELGAVGRQHPLHRIGDEILSSTNTLNVREQCR